MIVTMTFNCIGLPALSRSPALVAPRDEHRRWILRNTASQREQHIHSTDAEVIQLVIA